MKFDVRRAVAVPPATAMAAYSSPTFFEGRPVRDDIAVVEVVRHADAGTHIELEVRFAFTGSLSSAVRRVIDPAKMSWVTRTVLHPAEGCSEWEVLPDHYPDRLRASGSYRFEEGGSPQRTIVTVEGDFTVSVPLVGRRVEQVIVSDLRRYIEDEVASVPDFAR